MSLRLRIWAWALIVGFFAWFFFGVLGPSQPPQRLPLMAMPSQMIQPAIFITMPVVLLMATLLLMGRRLEAIPRTPFNLSETIFYATSLVLGSLPAILIVLYLLLGMILG